MMKIISRATVTMLLFILGSCEGKVNPNLEMINLLSFIAKAEDVANNPFVTEPRLKLLDSLILKAKNYYDSSDLVHNKAYTLLESGEEEKSIFFLEGLLTKIRPEENKKRSRIMKDLAIAWLRVGERTNCINNHSVHSCVFPIQGSGIHMDKTGSERAIGIYQTLLTEDPEDMESRWLLNIAYMTLDGYPKDVPPAFLIKGLGDDTSSRIKPFTDMAVRTGLNTKSMAGGSIVDDFNNDGYFDLVTSGWGLNEGMHYCQNEGNGAFRDRSDSSGLQKLTGGLNIMQTDYNNDGWKDIFVLRGAWKMKFGKEPNSLLRNNGDGTFTDVTKEMGLLSFHPTQAATWADFNNDGWLDVFIGNETTDYNDPHPCELYINNHGNGFTEIAAEAGCGFTAFVKGVTSGDYDNDGLTDLFLSTLSAGKVLLKNESANGSIRFKNVSQEAGLTKDKTRTFPTWFWDYDNDGWLDILVCGYQFSKSLAWYAAEEALDRKRGISGEVFLYKNKKDGTFEDVSEKVGLNKIAFAMGSNFGDIDNDGFLDIYLGTGNPNYTSLVPNKMFWNNNGRSFVDITSSARVGSLQKGHGVSFADMDNDGDQDIHIDMGGAYQGDAYQSSLYVNPGQNNNHWINISLEGVTCNKPAVGARIKVVCKENGVSREIYRDLNSGGSFGSSPFLQHIGIGRSEKVESIEIKWPGSATPQVFRNLKADETVFIRQGESPVVKAPLKRLDFSKTSALIGCAPM